MEMSDKPKKTSAEKWTIGIIVAACLFVIVGAIVTAHSPTKSSPNTSYSPSTSTTSDNTTPAQAIIDSKNQYYTPANAAAFSPALETAFANLCLSANGMANYSSSVQTRYCGCDLAAIEQNTTPAEIKAQADAGNSSAVGALSQYCNQLL